MEAFPFLFLFLTFLNPNKLQSSAKGRDAGAGGWLPAVSFSFLSFSCCCLFVFHANVKCGA